MGSSIAHRDRVADALVEIGQCGCPQHDLVIGIQAMSRQNWWGHRRTSAAAHQSRYGLAINLGIGELTPAPGGNIGIVVEELQGLRRDVIARVEHVAPVPPVKRRSRYQRA